MAKIRGEVDTTPDQEATLNEIFLPEVNAQRATQDPPLEPLADMDAYASWLLGEAMPDWVGKSKKKDALDIAELYEVADDATQNAVDDILRP